MDEAYIDFSNSDESMYKYINDLDNLIVFRTYSKSFSACGIRVGYIFSNQEIIKALFKTKDSYNVSYLSQVAAEAAMRDYDYMVDNCNKIIKSEKIQEPNY